MLFRIAGCAGLLVSAFPAPNAALAQTNEPAWPPALVCQASVQSYFALRQPPRQTDDTFGWLIFRSDLGGIYDCQVRGSFVALKWKSHNGTMTSYKTQFEASGAVLTVRPDGVSQWRFRRTADGYGLLSGGKAR